MIILEADLMNTPSVKSQQIKVLVPCRVWAEFVLFLVGHLYCVNTTKLPVICSYCQ